MVALVFALLLAATEPSAAPPAVAGFVTQPVWLTLPNGDDMARYRPEDARESGRAVIECTVSDRGLLQACQVLEETPGQHYGDAALKVASRFRMGPTDRGGLSTAGRKVRIPLTWALASPVKPSDPVSPRWLRLPAAEDMLKAYPAEALRNGKAGRAVVACRLTAAGAASACAVVEESPAGMGFGEAALRLAPTFQFSTKGPDGQSLVGGTFRIPLVWNAPHD